MDEQLLRFNTDKLLVFIDLETFNLCLNFQHNLPWQVAMIKVKGEKILEQFDEYVKWKTHLQISEGAAIVTKFDPIKFEQKAISPEAVYAKMYQWLAEADFIIGHNVLGFDVYLIKEWFRLNNHDPEPIFKKMIDTNCLAKAIKLQWPAPDKNKSLLEYQYPILNYREKGLKTNLKLLGEEYEIEHDYERLHDALIDLELNIKVWNKQKHMVMI